MKAYCKNGLVVATHDDDQNVDPSAYGDGVTVVQFDTIGELVRVGDPPPPGLPDTRPFRAPDPAQSTPAAAPPILVAAALNLQVVNDDFGIVGGVYNVVAAAYLGVGTYMIIFGTPLPDANYFVSIAGGSPIMEATNLAADSFFVEAKDTVAGAAVEAPPFGIQVFRIAA
jgi:hypothetical protein